MKEFIIQKNEAGQRFDKYLGKLLKEAPKSFSYKMLRKKNITLNGKKADGSEKLDEGDVVKLFLSEETFGKFSGMQRISYPIHPLDIVYEDENVALINKPVGMLSQPSHHKEPSLVEYFIGYLLEKKEITEESLHTFHPAVCNRLDRNTSGIVAAGKSLAGLQALSRMFHDRTMHKFYLTCAWGVLKEEKYIRGYLHKNEKCNKVEVYPLEEPEAVPIETRYVPLGDNGRATLLLVELITGRSHQIRAHLASIGHPIVGDGKYGREDVNRIYREKFGLTNQLLHGYKIEFPKLGGALENLSGRAFTAEIPEIFYEILKTEHLEESYHEILA